MILDRAFELITGGVRLRDRLLARRGRRPRPRPPVVIVPGMFGSRLVDGRGRELWGSTARLYFGPSIAHATSARADGVLDELTLVPGLLGYDIHGGLTRFLAARGGYRDGEDLVWLSYDWRTGVVDAAAALGRLIERIRGFGDEKVDLIGVSTGGQIVRYFLAHGGVDVLSDEKPTATGAGAAWVRRAIYIGGPQRGTFDALASIHRGFRFAPGGRRFRGEEAAQCQTALDALPHPDDPLFVDERGAPLDLDLYRAETWRALGLGAAGSDGLARRLERARRLHRALDAAPAAVTEATVIGARHLPTPARVVVVRGRARVPGPVPRADDPFVGFSYLPGDGELPESSLRALPGLDERRLWWVAPSAHHRLPSDRDVRRLALETLLATDRHIPKTDLGPARDGAR